jgi:hypothetical protein
MVRQDFMYDLSQDPKLPLAERLTWLVLSLMQDNGHVPFGPGELLEQLSPVDKETGERKIATLRAFFKAKAELVRRGILAANQYSGADRCLIASADFDRQWRPSKSCIHDEPKLRLDRSPTDFEPPY